MNRRSLLGAALLAGLGLNGIACTQVNSPATASGRPGGPDPGATTTEPGLPNWPLFEWEQPGGFCPPGGGVLRPPPLAVYGDDTAYADAAASRRLPPIWVDTLLGHALDVLGDPAEVIRGATGPPPDGCPDDQVRVRRGAGDYLAVRLPGWQDGDPRHAYPAQLRELYQHAMAIRRHVLATGRPWRPTGVLLAVVSLDHRPARFRPWPGALPTPGGRYEEYRLPDGPHGLPRATRPLWPCYRLGGNRFVAATWRSLLPHEIT